MAYSGGGVLRDVEIVQQDDGERIQYLVQDDNGADYALCEGYPAEYETCNINNPYGLIGAEISYTGITDTDIPNPWYDPLEPAKGPALIPIVQNPTVTACPT